MLGISKNRVVIIAFHDLAEYYLLNQLAADGYDGYLAIIGRCGHPSCELGRCLVIFNVMRLRYVYTIPSMQDRVNIE